jgi:endonuclease/exonuclease/phosphatase family metal-dependent hydrolase
MDNNIAKRPYMILVFSENIILINLHLSHVDQYKCFKKLQVELNNLKPYVNEKTIFIICGDFNNNDPTKIYTFNNLLKIFNRKLKKEPKTINTCCIPNGKKYNLSFDHIYISSNGEYDKYRTIKKMRKINLCQIIYQY